MPRKKESSNVPSLEEIALMGLTFIAKKEEIKKLNAVTAGLQGKLKPLMDTMGKETPAGHKVIIAPYADKDVILKNTLRVTRGLTAEAIEIAKENGLEEAIETVEVLREDVIERLYKEGKVTDDVILKLYVESKNYAFSVKAEPRGTHEIEDE